MYLREVTLNGFKSFAEITKLDLQPGVTAIVGPNGCGKSNIADAIRWVLGEQSAKSLRGGSMQDIIFGGSDKRKALPYSEVALIFTECEAELGASFHEVEVSRRVSRDGSSQYRINGKVSRLRDIQRLFMDTGVGQVAYSFLVQGQVDQILSTNPADRRTIFEEAAGITRYKSQRKETLNKLALVDSNLSRVSDVVDEVSRQIGSLKRQASKALRYKRLSHRQANLESALHAHQIRELDASIARLESETESLRNEASGQRRSIAHKEESLTGDRTRREKLHGKIDGLQEQLFEHRSSLENAESQTQMLDGRADDHRSRIERLTAEIERLREQKRELRSRSEQEAASRQEQLELLGDSDAEAARKREAFEEAARELAEKESAYRKEKESVVAQENEITRLRSKCTSLEVDLKSFEVRHASHAETVHSAEGEAETLLEKERKTRAALDQRSEQLADCEADLARKKEELETIRGHFRSGQSEIQELDRQLARLASRRQVLQDLQDRMEGFGEGAKAARKGALGEPFGADRIALLSNRIEVSAEYSPAIEALLGNAVDAIVWAESSELAELLSALREKNLPRTPILSRGRKSEDPKPPAGFLPADGIVRAKDTTTGSLLEPLLAGCYFAESEETVFEALASHPNFRYNRIATRSGTVFGSDGLIVAGKALDASKSLLGREAEIRRIGEEIQTLEKELDGKREAVQGTARSIESLETELETVREHRDETRDEKTTLESEIKALGDSRKENREALEEASRRMEELEASKGKSEAELEEARERLREAEDSLGASRTRIEEWESAIERLRNLRDERKEEWTNTRLDHSSKKQALELVEKGLDEIERRSGEIDRLCEEREEEIEQLKARIRESREEATRQRETAESARESLEETKTALETERQTLRELEGRLSAEEEAVADSRKELQRLEQEINRRDVELTKQRSRAEFIVEKSSSENEVDPRSIDWRRALWEADRDFQSRLRLDDLEEGDEIDLNPVDRREEPSEEDLENFRDVDWSAVETEAKELREKIASLGAVNLVAIEEYRDLKERHEFLKAQSQDLWNSKEELLRAIDEINETSQSLFQQTFDKIRENFRFTYDHLTNGGAADLQLIEAEDILDSGIEIKARPPGVRTGTLSLLSGGQRTMAAVALLFAIYMVKPSPFCVLDELDAPLDDANIGRFTDMLKRFTEFSQFLIITHNKRTIAASDSVFGVTMQEKGVSRLVSMRFNHHTQKAEFAEGELEGRAIATE